MNKKLIHTFLLWSLFTSAYAEVSHCRKDEVTYFSCPIERSNKIASLCGNIALNHVEAGHRKSSWLQYRFGRPGKLELTYPSQKAGSLSKFTGEFHRSAEGSDNYIYFTNNGIEYGIGCIDARAKKCNITAAGKEFICASQPIVRSGNEIRFDDLVIQLAPES